MAISESQTLALLKRSLIGVTLFVEHPSTWRQRSSWDRGITRESIGGLSEFYCTKCCQGKYCFLIFMVFRYPPFYDANPYDIYRRIAIGCYEFPANVSMAGRQLIAGLLEQDLSKRLGCLSGGAEDIKNNPWF
jgi:hypothetical protein